MVNRSPNGVPLLGYNPTHIAISNSEIQTFKDCRRKWWLAYYRGLQAREPKLTGPLPLGSRVHNALEDYYRNGTDLLEAYKRLLAVDRLLFEQTFEAQDDAKVKKFNDEAELGRVMLEGYLEWLAETNADSKLDVVGVEQKVSWFPEEFGGRVELIGKLDLVVRNRATGFISAFDHKTAASFDTYYKYALTNEQLRLYTLIMQESGDEVIDGGMYSLLKKSKRTARATGPFYERLHIRYNQADIAAFKQRTLGVVRDMIDLRQKLDNGEDHHLVAYPTPSNDCSWKCPFFHGCSMFDDGSAVEEWLAAGFTVGDPYARYEQADGQKS